MFQYKLSEGETKDLGRISTIGGLRMGDVDHMVEGGVVMTLERTSFAGSTTLISEMRPIVIAALGTGVTDAVAMVTSESRHGCGPGKCGPYCGGSSLRRVFAPISRASTRI